MGFWIEIPKVGPSVSLYTEIPMRVRKPFVFFYIKNFNIGIRKERLEAREEFKDPHKRKKRSVCLNTWQKVIGPNKCVALSDWLVPTRTRFRSRGTLDTLCSKNRGGYLIHLSGIRCSANSRREGKVLANLEIFIFFLLEFVRSGTDTHSLEFGGRE